MCLVLRVCFTMWSAPCNHRKFTIVKQAATSVQRARGREGEEVGKKRKELGAGVPVCGYIGAWVKVVNATFKHKCGEASHDRFCLDMEVSTHSIRVPTT